MSKFNELVVKLREIFQIDRPELDFGVYRILNARANEINHYLEHRLKEKVQAALSNGNAAQQEQLTRELKEKEAQYQADGIGSDELAKIPKIKELREKLAQYGVGANEHENAIFSHLLTFFSRYYDNGDFISQRRYKGDTYAIPYAGEEVMLHWANKDQYYTKSGENFSNYSFKLEDGRSVHFRLVAADTAKDNRKDNDKERRFVLIEQQVVTRLDDEGLEYEEELLPVEEVFSVQQVPENRTLKTENSELIIRFEYTSQPKGSKQEALNSKAIEAILGDATVKSRWLDLTRREPTEKNPQRTLLEKQLSVYTTKNTADYFIHKDLGGFLRRELDFYIKNEVMNLDDVQNADAFAHIEKSLRLIQCLRAVALELITFLAQLEDFQKKLWLKKKFVVSTHYCITLDRVPETLYAEVAENDRQWSQWDSLGLLNESVNVANAWGGGVTYLKAHCYLMLDTALFDAAFKNKLLAEINNLDEKTNGVLIKGDNFQALRLINKSHKQKIKCIYIDPPYNTGGDGFSYKDSYKNSSWLTMISNRLQVTYPLLAMNGVIYSSIDEKERAQLEFAMNQTFGKENRVEEVIWVQNATKNKSPTFSTNHEYIEVFAKDITSVKSDFFMFREPKPGLRQIMELIESFSNKFPPSDEIEKAIKELFKHHKKSLSESIKNDNEIPDDWKGIYNYNRAEYRDNEGKYVADKFAREKDATIWVWREDNPSMPQVKEDSQKSEFRDPADPAFRFYTPSHPTTGKLCPHPKTGWRWPLNPLGNQKNCFANLVRDNRIVWGEDEKKIPQKKSFLHEVETNVAKSVINDYTDGEKELANLFGKSRVFGGPKPTTLISRFITQAALNSEVFCDFFAGSGTSGEAIIKLNQSDDANRKFVLIEMGDCFENILIPRLQKTIFSIDWKDGKPQSNDGSSHIIKYIKLESYEDTLNNLALQRPQDDLFQSLPAAAQEDYMLRYMLDVESRGSLLSVSDFNKPFDYTMKIAVDSAGAFEERKVDLVETFNYLIGLTVQQIDAQPERGFVTVTGTLPSGESVLVLWRDCELLDYARVSKLCDTLAINPADNEYDVVYINGDHNIPTVLTHTQEDGGNTRVLKLRQIEAEFLELMFAVEGA